MGFFWEKGWMCWMNIVEWILYTCTTVCGGPQGWFCGKYLIPCNEWEATSVPTVHAMLLGTNVIIFKHNSSPVANLFLQNYGYNKEINHESEW